MGRVRIPPSAPYSEVEDSSRKLLKILQLVINVTYAKTMDSYWGKGGATNLLLTISYSIERPSGGGEKMNRKILTSTSIVLMIVLIVLIANFGVVFAIRGKKSKTASLNYANIGTTPMLDPAVEGVLLFGFFDKMKKSTQGAADCLDILLLIPGDPSVPTEDVIVPFGIVTDSETFQAFYAEVWGPIFPPAALVDEEVLEIWKKGSDIYVEVTDTISIPLMEEGTYYELQPFSMKIESEGIPYKAEIAAGEPLPTGWTFSRITQRGYDATVTFDSPTGTLMVLPGGTTQFNSLDLFTPPTAP